MDGRVMPSDSDSLMASALLAISRTNEDCEEANGKGKNVTSQRTDQHNSNFLPILSEKHVNGSLDSLCFGDFVSSVETRLSSNVDFDTSSTARPVISGCSAFPSSQKAMVPGAEAQVNNLALQAAMISDKAIAASFLKASLSASGIPPCGNLFLPFQAEGVSNSNPPEPKNIRRQEIVKALLSKPQRGRKRANLNDIERLELTRTRNREHAKSTRVRKKMRYEELLNCEKVLQENKFKEDLDSRRRGYVVDFLSIREQMLQNRFLPSISGEYNSTLKLGAIVEDIASVRFDGGLFQSEKSSALDQMNQFDGELSTAVLRECVCKPDVSFAKSISYRISGSSSQNDVALTTFGTAFAEVDVVIKCAGNDSKVLRSYLLKVEFAPESDKIRCIMMREMHCPSDEAKKRKQVLENQISHPSVVSLDSEKDQRRELETHFDKQTESDDGLGSGMTF